ncbi:hypothetical protein ACO1PF_03955 [Alkalibacterium sp. f15]|uniref:hypothetical protein n=1 Tax=Alkalibacterium sp. f15 TaxID=3414029 RepID=UPI003BF80013
MKVKKRNDNKKFLFFFLGAVVGYPIIDGILLYLGFDASTLLVSVLESLFG